MALSVKREILSHLKRMGIHFERSMLKVLPHSMNQDQNGIGRTFYIDLPTNTDSMMNSIHKINDNLLKTLQSYSPLIENVEIRLKKKQDSSLISLILQVNFEYLLKELYKNLSQNLHELFVYHRKLDETNHKQKIIVEYSSPNIAKPFHVGNLRSTIIGNSVANILEFNGHEVVRMNYLGDWGTQFGILSLAYDRFGDEQKLKTEPLKHLFEVYVKGNKECDADRSWKDLAKDRFHQMEFEKDPIVLEQWGRFRELSFMELEKLYERIGIEFDVYTSESIYSGCTKDIIDILRKKSLIEIIDGAVYANVSHYNDPTQNIQVPLLKNDGTSLYLTRDIAAVLHRKKQFNFDRMYYVVDSSQSKHFTNLKSIFYSLGDPIYRDIKHLKFGRILGMSTRKGEAVFLEDVLNEAKNRALQSIQSSPNTKITPDLYDQVADILGVASVLIHDLSNRRVSEYRFNWNRALKMTGDTGISIQYTHARLCNLIKKFHPVQDSDNEINTSAIDNPEGRILINLLLMFDEIVNSSCTQLEPSIITNYIFDLKTAINRANQELTLKGQSDAKILNTRLNLFKCSRNVLNQCMKLLGLRPLESM